MLSVWLALNAAIAVVIMRASSDVKSKFFIALLWSTCASRPALHLTQSVGLAVVRFFAFLLYMFGETLFVRRRPARLLISPSGWPGSADEREGDARPRTLDSPCSSYLQLRPGAHARTIACTISEPSAWQSLGTWAPGHRATTLALSQTCLLMLRAVRARVESAASRGQRLQTALWRLQRTFVSLLASL